ncbi:MAG: phosphatidylserine decarboxylase [Acidobacteriota bacterium]|jgi:phosphatidylserine decarboxylase|nr:phosphatidylserine decarboxylase [Acidobacteriota bacterium]NLT32207.1 phosphatidylserine decarboxylase [Acidobacteriota bacterium]
MATDAYRFLLPLLALGGLSLFFGLPALAVALLLLAAFTAFFFRNPARRIPDEPGLVVSPADGKVVKISRADDGTQTLSIFLSIFNVHVNRSPIDGILEDLRYQRGKFKVAFDEEASRVNEQNILTIAGGDVRLVVKQVAGLIARRVLCWKKPGEPVRRGELIGLIRFGSRVDVIVPQGVRLRVGVGDRVRGGSSVIGECV